MDVETRDMDRTEKLEVVATSRFLGLLPEYHRRMAEVIIHALCNWIPNEHVADALDDVRYYSNKVLEELDADIRSSRYGGHVG